MKLRVVELLLVSTLPAMVLAAKGSQEEVFAFMNKLRVIDISNNLGDSKSLITHPSSTTHRRLAPEVQAEMGITPSVLRLSVGLEHSSDLIKDIDQALAK